jgi:hypothetical protein
MKSLLSHVLGVIVVATCAVAQAQYAQPATGQPAVVVPPAESNTVRTTLITSGLVTFGVAYGSSVVVAATSNHEGDHHLYVPVIGPWLDLANRPGCDVNRTACDNETTNKVLLVVDGIFQGAGAVSLVAGLLTPPAEHNVTVVSDTKVHVVPVSFGAGSPGLAAFGRF